MALVALPFVTLTRAEAQSAGVRFDVAFDFSVDCDQPKEIRGVTVHGAGNGTLNADKSASADLTITAITSSTIHFEATLGGKPQPAPGGTSMLNVVSKDHLRLVWDLPNNQVITTVAVAGQSCSASVDFKLRYGNKRYSMFDGQSFYFCSKPKLLSSSCSVR